MDSICDACEQPFGHPSEHIKYLKSRLLECHQNARSYDKSFPNCIFDELWLSTHERLVQLTKHIIELCPNLSDFTDPLLATDSNHRADTLDQYNCPSYNCKFETNRWEGLKDHYRRHVPCSVKCAFCEKRLYHVSEAASHQRKCPQRRQRRVPAMKELLRKADKALKRDLDLQLNPATTKDRINSPSPTPTAPLSQVPVGSSKEVHEQASMLINMTMGEDYPLANEPQSSADKNSRPLQGHRISTAEGPQPHLGLVLDEEAQAPLLDYHSVFGNNIPDHDHRPFTTEEPQALLGLVLDEEAQAPLLDYHSVFGNDVPSQDCHANHF